ncbi:MAG: ATP-dependent sacrificial sulfur transferase LarE [Thermoprotei archaeon]|nr:MAG: ATP-dependent sacrificial sulfur transferase LarE [Thermoprotei archaeon]
MFGELASTLPVEVQWKLEELVKWFRGRGGPVVVAFSGGVDSSVVVAVAALALGPSKVVAVTASSPVYPSRELRDARRTARLLKVRHVVIETDELEDPDFASNPPERCFYCKLHLARVLKKVAREVGARVVVDGTNAEDLEGHRPGYLALKREGIGSPLAEVGFRREEVRLLARVLGLPNWNKPSMACLASRIPYGERITRERLARIEAAEELVRRLVGVRQVRVRDHGVIARIEVGRDEREKFFSEEVMDRVAVELMKLGYKYVTLDLSGYRSGSMDEVLSKKIVPLRNSREDVDSS